MKVALLGLDSVPPDVLFDKLLDRLPNIGKMYKMGIHGNLTTCHPPITVPAWMVMLTGKNPGRLGIYGFRHRKPSSYTDGYIVNSTHVKEKIIWDYLADKGLKSIVIGIPPGYPPRPLEGGSVISCFLTPSADRPFTFPPDLKDEVVKAAGGNYEFDVVFRTDDRISLKKHLFEMTEKRFDVAEHLARTKPWDFFALHEIGFDRLHHAFWKYFDPSHPKYVRGNEFEGIFQEYYSMVDGRIGRLLEVFGDDCITFLLSDHGSKGMVGAFCVNEWLAKEGYLVLKQRPSSIVELEKADVDWTKTKAWGWGGYYARIFFNVKGREPTGIIEPSSLDAEKKRFAGLLAQVKDARGRRMENRVFEPRELYGEAVGDSPDLMVYFDDLNWRSAGTVGHDSLYLSENDTGPDDSVHSMDGVFLMYNPKKDLAGKTLSGARIEDIAPTLMALYRVHGRPGEVLDGHELAAVVDGARN
jgi:predicted AlkP superfamily phosphohydrolase/phosphomutase